MGRGHRCTGALRDGCGLDLDNGAARELRDRGGCQSRGRDAIVDKKVLVTVKHDLGVGGGGSEYLDQSTYGQATHAFSIRHYS